jgi:transposase
MSLAKFTADVFVASTADFGAPVAAPQPKLTADELRRQRGLVIAGLCYIRTDGSDSRYRVPSQTGKCQYLVSIDPKKGPDWQCDCDDFEKRGLPCKHIYAVRFLIERDEVKGKGKQKGENPVGIAIATATNALTATPVPVTVIPATKTMSVELKTELSAQTKPKKPTYKQDWPAYNLAQTTEKDRFQGLLAELCRGVPEPARPHDGTKGGRPPVPMAARVFASAFKIYSTISGRRFTCDMKDARSRGHVSQAPHYNSIARYLESPELTPILGDLIRESALPLRIVEQDFAVDATGFGTSRFVRWYDQKYGIVRQRSEFVKVSITTGVKTNIVTAVRVGGQYSGESPDFVPMVKETARGFTLREVSADGAFASYDNFDGVAALGGTAYIAFPVTATGRLGGTYGKMLREFNVNQDKYLAHYHKRSNVESTFSMIKAKFGDSVRSKTDTAMVNEALCKVLCHNLCCLISSTHELGVEATFWRDEPETVDMVETEVADDGIGIWDWI